MPTVVESEIEFSFTPPASVTKFDSISRQWPAVDFIIDEFAFWIWLEIKNWEPSSLHPRRRGGQRRSFLSKIQRREWFTNILRSKFLGTSAYLAHAGAFVAKPLTYVALLESPRMDSALMLRANERLDQLVRPAGPWKQPVSAIVVNLSAWNQLFPEYPARAI